MIFWILVAALFGFVVWIIRRGSGTDWAAWLGFSVVMIFVVGFFAIFSSGVSEFSKDGGVRYELDNISVGELESVYVMMQDEDATYSVNNSINTVSGESGRVSIINIGNGEEPHVVTYKHVADQWWLTPMPLYFGDKSYEFFVPREGISFVG